MLVNSNNRTEKSKVGSDKTPLVLRGIIFQA